MERLTYEKSRSRWNEGRFQTKYTSRHTFQEVVARLAAYEDTGLEPEEITTEPYGCVFYCNRKCNFDGDFCAEGPGCPWEIDAGSAKHLLELAQAEKDGRLVVLPCKEGDPVWWIGVNWLPGNGKMYHQVESGKFRYAMLDWQNPIYTSQAEAEAALKKREED